eukprot:5985947-Pyramimonas_sp.AAC.1
MRGDWAEEKHLMGWGDGRKSRRRRKRTATTTKGRRKGGSNQKTLHKHSVPEGRGGFVVPLS